jgi:hypothetical protein
MLTFKLTYDVQTLDQRWPRNDANRQAADIDP